MCGLPGGREAGPSPGRFRGRGAGRRPECRGIDAYFETCRRKRNQLDYDAANMVSDTEAVEILEKAREFKQEIEDWIAKDHPGLAP
jgi:hypothetical protein